MTTFYLGKDTKGVFKRIIEHIKSLDFEKKWEITIKEHKLNRSQAQNRLLHKWVGIFADECGYDPKNMKHALKEEFLEKIQFEMNGVIYERLPSTAELKVKPFANFLRDIEVLANEYSLILPRPEDQYYLAIYGKRAGNN